MLLTLMAWNVPVGCPKIFTANPWCSKFSGYLSPCSVSLQWFYLHPVKIRISFLCCHPSQSNTGSAFYFPRTTPAHDYGLCLGVSDTRIDAQSFRELLNGLGMSSHIDFSRATEVLRFKHERKSLQGHPYIQRSATPDRNESVVLRWHLCRCTCRTVD